MNTIQMTVGQRKIAAAQKSGSFQFWQKALEGAASTAFRADFPDRGRTEPMALVSFAPVGSELADRIQKGSGDNDRAISALLAAASSALLRAHTAEVDNLIGIHNGSGAYPAFLPLRIILEDEDSLRSLLGKVRSSATDAFSHLDFPTEVVGAAPRIAVLVSDAQLFQARSSGIELGFCYSKTPQGGRIDVFADRARFKPITVELIGNRLVRLLEQMTGRPDDRIDEFDLLLDFDRELISSVNETDADIPRASLTELFRQTVGRIPQRTAILTDEKTYSFAELDNASGHIAAALLTADLGPNPVVGVLSQRSFGMLAAILGILKIGGAYMPIDPTQPAARIEYMLENSQAGLVLADPSVVHVLPAARRQIEISVNLAIPDRMDLPVVQPSDAAYVIYTSGSTGMPKGVVVEHDSVVNRLKWMQDAYPIGDPDVILQKTPITFDVSVWELFWWLIEGSTVALLAPGGEREPGVVIDAIERFGVTTMHFVPTMLGAFLDYVGQTREEGRLHSLRQVFASGEALQPHQADLFLETFKSVSLINLYGPTEATVDVSHHLVVERAALVPIGKPIANTRLHVLGKNLAACGVGMVGELHIAGRGLARGYLNRPELTSDRFVTIPRVDDGRLYKTGDLARWLPDGTVDYLGRSDFQVKLRGYRIELGEIEHALRKCEGVEDAVVVLRTTDEGQQHLHAYIVGHNSPIESALKASLAEMLPAYMVPERILRLEAFPLSPNGKLDRKSLPEPTTSRARYVAPVSDVEKQLASIWSDVLGVLEVGVTESFFALGGNSIHFVSVLAKARKLGLNFSFQQLFQHPTIESLIRNAEHLADDDIAPESFPAFSLITSTDRTRLPDGVDDAYPMSMLQVGLIFQSEIMRGNNSYHDIASYLIQGEMDVDLFRRAVAILVQNNPIFRTSYSLKDYDEYLQIVHTTVDEIPLFVEDLRGIVPEEQQDDYYSDWFKIEQDQPFTWDIPGLVRLHVHIIADDLFRYSISQHNSMLDGWSMNQVHTKLFEIYYSLRNHGSYQPIPVDNHLRNFVGLERHAIQSGVFKAFWDEQLKERPPAWIPRLRNALPADEIDVTFQDIPLSRDLSDQIINLANVLGVPVKTILLAAHMKMLATVTGRSDVMSGYEHAGRPELPGAERALGVFLNTMPFRMAVQPGTWSDLIRQTYQTEANALPYRRYPMAKVKQDLQTTDLLFETVFNFTHFYSLKELKKLPEFALLDVRASAITEFPLRVEFSRHFYTDEVQLSLHFHTREFDPAHIARMGGYIVRALRLMTENAEAMHNARSVLEDDETDVLATFADNHPERPRLVDDWGMLTPVGTPGWLSIDGSVTARRAKWSDEGKLVAQGDEISVESTKRDGTSAPETNEIMSPEASRLALVWAEVLKLPPAQLRSSDDFFEIGGNSLSALRVVLKLDGAISLRDFMQHSRLHELAEVLAGSDNLRVNQPSELLIPLVMPTDAPSCSMVMLPYAGGNALHFRPFAEALRGLNADFDVFGVELPGHVFQGSEGLLDFAATSAMIADAVHSTAAGPISLWGHCIGSALALDVARKLVDRGVEVRHLFLGAKLLYEADEIRATLANANDLTFGDIEELYSEWSGADSLVSLGHDFQAFLVRTFRHDSLEANGHLLALQEAAHAQNLMVPCTLVVADDDPATTGYPERYAQWARLLPQITLQEVSGGSHYFMRTKPSEVAELVTEILK